MISAIRLRQLIACIGIIVTLLSASVVPWRVHATLKGDDAEIFWRYAPIWQENHFSTGEMSLWINEQRGLAVSPSDVFPVLDYTRVWLQHLSLALILAYLWLLTARTHPTTFST
jgi:hypothetical protein